MPSSRWTRRVAAMAAVATLGAQATVTKWPVSCTGGTFVVSNSGSSVTGTCSQGSQVSTATLDSDAAVSLVLNNVAAELTVTFATIEALKSLTITAGSGTVVPKVTVAGGLASTSGFYSLSLDGVELTTSELSLSAEVNYLSVVNSSATNISTSTDIKLKELVLGDTYSKIPTILYQANYSEISDAKTFKFTQDASFSISIDDAQQLSKDEVDILEANVGELTDIGVSCNELFKCTSESASSQSKNAVDSNLPFPSSPSSSSGRNNAGSTSSSNSTDVQADESGGGDGLGTALIVVIVIVVLVALGLLFFIVRHCRARRSASAANGGDDNTVTLMAKAETPGGGNHHVKGSFISSDEFLRTFRVEQSDVSLTKSLGTGRLWMGEYQNNKVIIKRIEAEVTEPFVTKEFRNQARTLATLNHPNIVSLVGVTWLAGTDFAVIAEFQAKGNLKSVLSNLDIDLDVTAKLQICLDVARGLAYLHDPERNMCMKTLSSRKVLVGSTMACKLNVFECVSAGVKIDRGISFPYGMGEIAWLAPEVITRSAPMDARKANIFAFGVLAGEILTRSTPYQNMVDELGNTLSDVTLVKRIKDRRPLCPHETRHEYAHAPPSLREAVEACLSYDTMSRPTAEQLVLAMERALEEARTGSI